MDRYAPPEIKDAPYDQERDWWSIFPEELTAERAAEFFTVSEPVCRERRGLRGIVHLDGTVEIPGDFAYMIGESMPMQTLRDLNGRRCSIIRVC